MEDIELEGQGRLSVNGTLRNGDEIQEHIRCLFAYRTLDVLYALCRPSGVVTTVAKRPIPVIPKIVRSSFLVSRFISFIKWHQNNGKDISDWPAVLQKARRSLQSKPPSDSKHSPVIPSQKGSQMTLIKSYASRQKTLLYHKVLENIECVAINLGWMLEVGLCSHFRKYSEVCLYVGIH